MKTRRIILALLLVVGPLLAMAQAPRGGQQGQGPRFSPEQFKQQFDAFITREAKLTAAEAQSFLPVYHQMRDEQRAVNKEIGKYMRASKDGSLGEKESLTALNTIHACQKKVIAIEENYQKRFLKMIPASKLLAVQMAEKRFERGMLHRMGGGKGRNPNGPQQRK